MFNHSPMMGVLDLLVYLGYKVTPPECLEYGLQGIYVGFPLNKFLEVELGGKKGLAFYILICTSKLH